MDLADLACFLSYAVHLAEAVYGDTGIQILINCRAN